MQIQGSEGFTFFLVIFALVGSLDFFGLGSCLENGRDNIALNL